MFGGDGSAVSAQNGKWHILQEVWLLAKPRTILGQPGWRVTFTAGIQQTFWALSQPELQQP